MGATVVLLFALAGLLAPAIAPRDPLEVDVLQRLRPPSPEHWLGTDELGRDVLSRLLFGATTSIRAGFAVVVVGIAVGVPIGAASAYAGGILDLIVQRLIDVIQAFPGILLLILVAALVGPSLELAIFALGFLATPVYSRLIRGTVLAVKEFAYVEAARATGCGPSRILVRHVLPNAISPVIVQSSLQLASAVVLLASISFLGLGAQPPTPEWGSMVAEGRNYMRSAPHVILFPSLAVAMLVLGLNLVGDALRDALDPRSVIR